jgi:hypothetical protein
MKAKLRTPMDDTTTMKILYTASNLRCNSFRNIDRIFFIGVQVFDIRGQGRTQDFRDDTAVDAVRTSMIELVNQLGDKLAT